MCSAALALQARLGGASKLRRGRGGQLGCWRLGRDEPYRRARGQQPTGARKARKSVHNELPRRAAPPPPPLPAQGGGKLTKKMFVGGTGEVTDDDFQNYFAQFGNIVDCVVRFACPLLRCLSLRLAWAGLD